MEGANYAGGSHDQMQGTQPHSCASVGVGHRVAFALASVVLKAWRWFGVGLALWRPRTYFSLWSSSWTSNSRVKAPPSDPATQRTQIAVGFAEHSSTIGAAGTA